MKKTMRCLSVLTVIAFAALIGLAFYDGETEREALQARLEKIESAQGTIGASADEQAKTAQFIKEIEESITREETRRVSENLSELQEDNEALAAKVAELREMVYRAIDNGASSYEELQSIVSALARDFEDQEDREEPSKAVDDLAPLVNICFDVYKITPNIYSHKGSPTSLSGFIIRWDGEPLIITAGHFWPGSGGSITNINCFFGDGSPATMLEFVGLSQVFDFAVFKFKKNYEYNRRCFSLGTSSALTCLSPVITLGSPLVFSHGVHFLSGYGQVLSPNFHSGYSGSQPSVILHTAITNSGNSGGPLLDSEGCVVGITVGVMEKRNVTIDMSKGEMSLKLETNMFTATPIDDVKRALPKILKNKWVRHGQIRGLQIESSSLIAENDFKKLGISQPAENVILVTSVGKKSGAEEAGFLPGDIILSVNDSFITHPNDFVRELAHREADERVIITVDRKGVTIKLPVILEAFASSLPPIIVK